MHTQPGDTFLACSAPLSGSALSAVQVAGGYVGPFGYPASASFASNRVSNMCGMTSLPRGSGGNPIALTMNGQVIDTVRTLPERGGLCRLLTSFSLAPRRSAPPAPSPPALP